MDKIEKHDNTEFTIDVQALAAENRSRNEGLQVPYDPLTGEGCCGERQKIQTNCGERRLVSVPVAGEVWLPVPMLSEVPLDMLSDELTYQKTRIKYDFEYWCATCATVRDKVSGRNVKLRLNAPQRHVLADLER